MIPDMISAMFDIFTDNLKGSLTVVLKVILVESSDYNVVQNLCEKLRWFNIKFCVNLKKIFTKMLKILKQIHKDVYSYFV